MFQFILPIIDDQIYLWKLVVTTPINFYVLIICDHSSIIGTYQILMHLTQTNAFLIIDVTSFLVNSKVIFLMTHALKVLLSYLVRIYLNKNRHYKNFNAKDITLISMLYITIWVYIYYYKN